MQDGGSLMLEPENSPVSRLHARWGVTTANSVNVTLFVTLFILSHFHVLKAYRGESVPK